MVHFFASIAGHQHQIEDQVVEVDIDLGISELFYTKGIDEAMDQSKSMCESQYLYEYVEPKAKEMNV